MTRGLARRTLFESRADIRYFLALLARLVRAGRLEVHSYSVLSTHFHLLVTSPVGELSSAMQWLLNQYVRWFNRSRRRDGPLLRGRFVSKRVDSLTYRRHLVRYIDFNPVAAGLVATPPLYPHGSAADYARGRGRPWLTRDWVASQVGERAGAVAAESYAKVFGEPLTPGLTRWIEARLHACGVEHDPLDELLDAAPPKVLAWMRRKAELADGTGVGESLCDAGDLHTFLGRQLLDGGDKGLMTAGLLRDLTADTLQQIATHLGTSPTSVGRWAASHRARLTTDAEYAERASTLACDALRELHRGAVVRCQSNLHRAAQRNGQPERNGGAVQIALAPYNRACGLH
jgi:REP element-mobilizing transposase RayT/DNA-binding transcriptional regulator YdaS (Cro superfamily)